MNSLFVYTTTQQIKKQNIFGSHPLAIILFFSSLLSWLTHGVVVDEQSELRPALTWNEKIVLMWNENRRWEFFSVTVDRCLLTKINSKSHFTIQHAMRNLNSARNTKMSRDVLLYSQNRIKYQYIYFLFILLL